MHRFCLLPVLVVFFSCCFVSCEREVNIIVQQQEPKLVVDGSIENNQLPVVILSNSLNYFSSISQEELAASFIHDAEIDLSDGSKTIRLKEYSVMDTGGYTFYYYTVNGTRPADLMVGEFNTQYFLHIQTPDGERYDAATTIPLLAKTCDSIFWKPAPNNPDTSLCVLYGHFNDPPGLGNYVRYYTSVNGQRFFPGFNSVFDDQVTDGTSYNFEIPKGFNKSDTSKLSDDDFGFFHRGDTATFKFSNIDKGTFDFWRTWEFSYQANGNPFASPTKVLSNVSNGALGAFSGYASQYLTLIIPK